MPGAHREYLLHRPAPGILTYPAPTRRLLERTHNSAGREIRRGPRSLGALLREAGFEAAHDADPFIEGIRTVSGEVRPGDLFVALRGSLDDGHAHLDEALARGAAAVVLEHAPAGGIPVPQLLVEDGRAALARLAAVWFGEPASALKLIGITGTVGKTSVLSIVDRIMTEAGLPFGSIGSLGVTLNEETLGETGFTAPDALVLHGKLADLRDAGARSVAMEVTSHALAQKRVDGLRFDLGAFTNLLPLEHQDYHGTFESYVETKLLFFDHLRPGAAVVHNADDRAVATVVAEREAAGVSVGRDPGADVRIENVRMSADGSRFTLSARAALPDCVGHSVAPFEMRLEMPLLGLGSISNVGIAVTLAMMLGASAENVPRVVRALPPARRRMEVIHRGDFTVIDDTVGHPESVNAVFEAARSLAPERFHIVVAVRGQRGDEINHHIGESLAIWCGQTPVGTLVVTSAIEAADARNTVSDAELEALIGPLGEGEIDFISEPELRGAIERALGAAGPGDLVLLLGAQAMDAGAAIVQEWLARRAAPTG